MTEMKIGFTLEQYSSQGRMWVFSPIKNNDLTFELFLHDKILCLIFQYMEIQGCLDEKRSSGNDEVWGHTSEFHSYSVSLSPSAFYLVFTGEKGESVV